MVRTCFFLILCLALFALPVAAAERLLVFAAASQKDALEAIGERYETLCECSVLFSFAATSTLARQIDAGAPADVFVSANEAWADWLEIRGRINQETRSVIAGNRLVIASNAKTRDSFNILFHGRFAMADPVSVPAGIYAREAMEHMGIWDRARKNAVFSENVRVALVSVARGYLLSGIVYASDVHFSDDLHAYFTFPESVHAPIHYVATTTHQTGPGEAFVEYMKSEEAQLIFERFGFLPRSATETE